MSPEAWILVGGRLVDTAELRRRAAAPPSLVVAADGGVRHAALLGVRPVLWVGDFDSSDPHDPRFAALPREGVPREKDFTDAELALDRALALGARRVTFWGAFGGRADHAFALALLAVRTAGRGVAVELHSGDESGVPLLPGPEVRLRAEPGARLSVLALDDLAGLDLAGVRWPLAGADVPAGSGWTVSNEATGAEVRARLRAGRALVVQGWSDPGAT